MVETVKSRPVCRIAVLYVFPSMPTHADAAYSPSVEAAPEGDDGVGTVIFPETALKVCPEGGEVIAAPLQFSLYSTSEVFPVAALNFVLEFLEFLDSFDRKEEP